MAHPSRHVYDAVVVGAGAAGLSAAILLADHGQSTCLVEADRAVAPLLRGFRREGVRFDTGFHCSGGLGPGGILRLLLDRLGLQGIEAVPLDPEGFDTIRFEQPELTFRFPWGRERILRAFGRNFPGEKPAVERFLDQMDQAWAQVPFLNPDSDVRFDLDYALEARYGESLQERLEALTDNAMVRALLSTHVLLHGALPAEVTFLNHARFVASFYHGVHTVRGGGASLSAAFARRLAELEVTVRCGSPVQALCGESRVQGVELADGSRIAARQVIWCAHPRNLAAALPPALAKRGFRARLEGLEDTFSAHLLFAVCDRLPEWLERGNMFLTPDPESIGRLAAAPLEERVLHLTGLQGHAGPGDQESRTPRGPNGVMIACPASQDEIAPWSDSTRRDRLTRPASYQAFKQDLARRLLERVHDVFPELDGSLRMVDVATPLTLRDRLRTPCGSLYGVKHAMGQHTPLPVTRINGLTLAGQAVTGPGLLGAVTSAFLAAGTIVGMDQIQNQMRRTA